MARRSAKKTDNNVLHLGVDLGTSRSVVAASNGRRQWCESYVGWPKDFVAKKALGNAPVFGSAAINHRLSLDVCRPLQHGVIKEGTARDEESVRALIRHLVELAEPQGERVYAAVGVPAAALKVNKLALKEAAAQFADTLMIISEPFAVAYGGGVLNDALVIDIGAGTVDFCVMHGTMPSEEDQRTILTAGDHIDAQLLQLLGERYPEASFSLEGARQYKEEAAYVGRVGHVIEVSVPVSGRVTTVDITKEIKRACETIVPPLVETTFDLIAQYDADYQERLRSNIILAGGGSQIENLADELEKAFNKYGPSKVQVVDDALYAGAQGALALAQDMPEEYWEEM